MKSSGFILALLLIYAYGQEDSLRSALDAFDRRQEEFPERYDDSEYGYPLERPEDLAFIKAASEYTDKNSLYDQALTDYLEDQDQEDVKKRIYSSFRERVEEDKQKQLEEMAQSNLENTVDSDDIYDLSDDEYDILRKLWEKYQHYNQPHMYNTERSKRYYYPQFGLGESVGLRKRSKYYSGNPSETSLYILNYPHDENRLREDGNNNGVYRTMRDSKWGKLRPYGYQQIKRFPVTKRSSDYNQKDFEVKKSELKKETDPKVAKELSNVFGVKTPDTIATTTEKPLNVKEHAHVDQKNKKMSKNEEERKPKRLEETKEVASLPGIQDKPLQIKKKSADWSDYWGLDRRKKADNQDNEWLIERYHKAISMAAKRNAEIPLSSLKNHDIPDKKESNEKILTEEERINDMDAKLKNMEDTIVDDALKFTGAHEGVTDSQEVQAVKNKVISRLAAAYSLEKMRNALGEYKLAVTKERERLKLQRAKEPTFQEEKRTSVPRKQAVDERSQNEDSDNNIKCIDGNPDDCLDQNGLSVDLLERHFGQDTCTVVEKSCNEVLSVLGNHAHKFEKPCNMYQMCMICTSNIRMSPVSHCNTLFLAKANELCGHDESCKREAKNSLRFLVSLNRSLQADPAAPDQCESRCPNMETLSELFDLR